MAKRNYNVKGTKDFLVLALIFFFLCLWAIKDAWYPSSKVIDRHPLEVAVTAPRSGRVSEFRVQVGSKVLAPQEQGTQQGSVVAKLDDADLIRQRITAGNEYKKIKVDPALPKRAEELRQELARLSDEIEMSLLRVPELGNEKSGKITKILVPRYDVVEAGQPMMLIKPDSHFYLFNKSLAIFSFIAFWVFLAVHILAH